MNKKEQKRLQAKLTSAHNTYGKGLNARAFFKTHNRATGEDLVQDTFLKTWIYLARGRKINLIKAFLYHILNNLIIDEYRKEKYKPISLDALTEKGFRPSIDESEHLFNALDGQKALLLIKSLPKIYRKVMSLKHIKGLSLKEMSKLTGQSKNAIDVQEHRGLAKLRMLYKKISGNSRTRESK